MRIHFNGAAQTVTGSQYLLEINGSRLLMECGLPANAGQEMLTKYALVDKGRVKQVILVHGEAKAARPSRRSCKPTASCGRSFQSCTQAWIFKI